MISLTIVSHDHSLMIQAYTQEYGNPWKNHILYDRNASLVKCLVSMGMK